MAKGDKLAAARSSNRDAPLAKPGPKQSCSDVVNICAFFDDTGKIRTLTSSCLDGANHSIAEINHGRIHNF